MFLGFETDLNNEKLIFFLLIINNITECTEIRFQVFPTYDQCICLTFTHVSEQTYGTLALRSRACQAPKKRGWQLYSNVHGVSHLEDLGVL
jgi:hypothetical protein